MRFDDVVLEATRELNIYCFFPHASLSSDAREFWRATYYMQHIRIVTIKISGTSVEKKVERVLSKTGYFSLSCEVVD